MITMKIQPVGNNMFLLDDEKAPVKTVEDLQDVNRKICDLGKQFGKPVVATCDVHFLDPEDEIYRRIMMAGKASMTQTVSHRCFSVQQTRCLRSSSI